MLAALGWGSLAASSLVLGALLAFGGGWSERRVGVVLAFGAGALISAVSFELAAEGVAVGGLGWVGLGLAFGALTYYGADRLLERPGAKARSDGATETGTALALGAFLDGIPEQLVLGIGLAAGEGVGVGLLVAIFVSNLPEAIGSAREMVDSGRSRGSVLRLWLAVAVVCALATVAGHLVGDGTGGELRTGIDGFAAGALLVMLVDSMIPSAFRDAGRAAGLVTVLGFAVALALSSTS